MITEQNVSYVKPALLNEKQHYVCSENCLHDYSHSRAVMLVLGLGLKAKFCGLGLAMGWPWPWPKIQGQKVGGLLQCSP